MKIQSLSVSSSTEERQFLFFFGVFLGDKEGGQVSRISFCGGKYMKEFILEK